MMLTHSEVLNIKLYEFPVPQPHHTHYHTRAKIRAEMILFLEIESDTIASHAGQFNLSIDHSHNIMWYQNVTDINPLPVGSKMYQLSQLQPREGGPLSCTHPKQDPILVHSTINTTA